MNFTEDSYPLSNVGGISPYINKVFVWFFLALVFLSTLAVLYILASASRTTERQINEPRPSFSFSGCKPEVLILSGLLFAIGVALDIWLGFQLASLVFLNKIHYLSTSTGRSIQVISHKDLAGINDNFCILASTLVWALLYAAGFLAVTFLLYLCFRFLLVPHDLFNKCKLRVSTDRNKAVMSCVWLYLFTIAVPVIIAICLILNVLSHNIYTLTKGNVLKLNSHGNTEEEKMSDISRYYGGDFTSYGITEKSSKNTVLSVLMRFGYFTKDNAYLTHWFRDVSKHMTRKEFYHYAMNLLSARDPHSVYFSKGEFIKEGNAWSIFQEDNTFFTWFNPDGSMNDVFAKQELLSWFFSKFNLSHQTQMIILSATKNMTYKQTCALLNAFEKVGKDSKFVKDLEQSVYPVENKDGTFEPRPKEVKTIGSVFFSVVDGKIVLAKGNPLTMGQSKALLKFFTALKTYVTQHPTFVKTVTHSIGVVPPNTTLDEVINSYEKTSFIEELKSKISGEIVPIHPGSFKADLERIIMSDFLGGQFMPDGFTVIGTNTVAHLVKFNKWDMIFWKNPFITIDVALLLALEILILSNIEVELNNLVYYRKKKKTVKRCLLKKSFFSKTKVSTIG